MGYYTRFELETLDNDYDLLKEVINNDDYELNYIFYEDGESVDETKWYDHEADMKVISENYPNKVFVLKGEGEESGDLWVKYFKNGMIQRCHAKITFDEYDESKLVSK